MEKESIFMEMEVITMEIGWKEKWRELGNCTIQMEIFSMMESGKTIIIMEKEHYMDLMMLIG